MRVKMMLSAPILLTILFAWQIAAAESYDTPVNLLHNPSFEQPAENNEELAHGWGLYQCGYTRTRERSYAPDIAGPWSCRITAAGGEDEKGVGGTNIGVPDVPAHGTFAATNSIYVDTIKQGAIYGAYVTARYTDGTEDSFSFRLSDEQVQANLGTWKTYRFTFTTDPMKTMGSMTYWCLVWSRDDQKFVGTVYFDETELRQIPADGQAEAALPFARASRTQTPPQIDGVADDGCWQQALALPPFLRSSGVEAATEQTRAQIVWDDDNLYLLLECFESALDPVLQKRDAFKAEQTEHDANVFGDDAVEFFLQPDQEQSTYYHIAVNSLGTIYDARCEIDGAMDKSWESGATAAGMVGERSWTVEVAIPRAQLHDAGLTEDTVWRVNLCRGEKPSSENSCWSPTGGGFHTPARFGLLAFGPPTMGGGEVDLGDLRKGTNVLRLTATNPGDAPGALSVAVAAGPVAGSCEVSRAEHSVAPGATDTIDVEYVARTGQGALRYEIAQDGRLLLVSPNYPLHTNNPFIAWLTVRGEPMSQVVNEFGVAEGETLALPLVLLSGIEEEQFRDATVTLEVPSFLRLVSPLSGERAWSAPTRVEEEPIVRDSMPYRRLKLAYGPRSITFAQAREQRQYVENPLIFRAEYVGDDGAQRVFPLGYQVAINGRETASGSVPLTLLPPFARKSPSEVVASNWPAGSVYAQMFFSRLTETEQTAIFDSWTHSGFNIYTHSGRHATERGLTTARGLPGTLDALCAAAPGITDYLRENPQYQDRALDGTPLPLSIAPARLLEEDCPARQMLMDYAADAAEGQPVLSWDYEVPVAYPQSSGFGEYNLAAFRDFAGIAADVELTPETVAEDYRAQWIDFRCHQNAGVTALLQEGIKAGNPDCMFFVYSGYQGDHTRETYGIDWRYIAPFVDQVWCGYGRPVERIEDTLEAIGDRPLVCGELVWLGSGNLYPLDNTELALMRRLTDSGGGFMVYYDWFVDGRFYSAISRTAAVAADFEEFFLNGRRDDSLATVEEGDERNLTVYALGDERLVFLFGTSAPQQFRLQVQAPASSVATDYRSKQPVALTPALEADVPARGVKVIHVRPSADAAQPATPQPVSPVDETVRDRRPLLLWQHEGGADCRYRVEVASDRDFAEGTVVVATETPANTCVVTEALDETVTYYWRVQAIDAHNDARSEWSPTSRFTLGVLDVAVQPAIFSPDGDGLYETVSVRAELRSEEPWTLEVADAAGRVIRRLSGEGLNVLATWDGKDEDGDTVADGQYTLRLDAAGRTLATETVELNSNFGKSNPELERWCMWRPVGLEGGSAEKDYSVAPEGLPYSLRVTGDSPEARAYWSNYRTGTEIPITAGKTYTFTGLVRTDLVEGGKAAVRLHFFTKDDRWAAIPGLEAEWEGISEEATGRQDWTPMTVVCEAPANAAKAVLFFAIEGEGSAWLGSAQFGEAGR